MVFPYFIDPWRRAAIVTLSGTVRGPALIATVDAIFHDPEWKPTFDRVWSGTTITELLVEESDLAAYVACGRQRVDLGGTGREVIVVEREVDRVIARMYVAMMLREGRTVYICDTKTEAWRWLDDRT